MKYIIIIVSLILSLNSFATIPARCVSDSGKKIDVEFGFHKQFKFMTIHLQKRRKVKTMGGLVSETRVKTKGYAKKTLKRVYKNPVQKVATLFTNPAGATWIIFKRKKYVCTDGRCIRKRKVISYTFNRHGNLIVSSRERKTLRGFRVHARNEREGDYTRLTHVEYFNTVDEEDISKTRVTFVFVNPAYGMRIKFDGKYYQCD